METIQRANFIPFYTENNKESFIDIELSPTKEIDYFGLRAKTAPLAIGKEVNLLSLGINNPSIRKEFNTILLPEFNFNSVRINESDPLSNIYVKVNNLIYKVKVDYVNKPKSAISVDNFNITKMYLNDIKIDIKEANLFSLIKLDIVIVFNNETMDTRVYLDIMSITEKCRHLNNYKNTKIIGYDLNADYHILESDYASCGFF